MKRLIQHNGFLLTVFLITCLTCVWIFLETRKSQRNDGFVTQNRSKNPVEEPVAVDKITLTDFPVSTPASSDTRDYSQQEKTLRDQLFNSKMPRKRGVASLVLNRYYVDNFLFEARSSDSNLSIKLLALWELRKKWDPRVPKDMIQAIQQETGWLPPRDFVKTLYSYSGRSSPMGHSLVIGLDYEGSDSLQRASKRDGVIMLENEEIVSRSKLVQITHFFTLEYTSAFQDVRKPSDYKYRCNVFQKGQLQVIIYYIDDKYDYQGMVLLRDKTSGKILWNERLLGVGNYQGGFSTGASLPINFLCTTTDKYVCVYGHKFVELFDRKTGERKHAFSVDNWGIR